MKNKTIHESFISVLVSRIGSLVQFQLQSIHCASHFCSIDNLTRHFFLQRVKMFQFHLVKWMSQIYLYSRMSSACLYTHMVANRNAALCTWNVYCIVCINWLRENDNLKIKYQSSKNGAIDQASVQAGRQATNQPNRL